VLNGGVKTKHHYRFFLIPIAIYGCLAAGCADKSNPPTRPHPESAQTSVINTGPYGYESGILEFRVRRPHHQADESVYFRDWGRQEARYETVSAIAGEGEAAARHQITIINAKGVFTWQVENQIGSRSPLPPPQPFQDYEKLKAQLGPEGAAKRLRNLDVILGKPEMVLGFTCHVFHLKGGTFWIHRGLVLRSRIKLGDFSTSREAVRFVPDATVDPSRFRFPQGADPASFPGLTDPLNEASGNDRLRTRS